MNTETCVLVVDHSLESIFKTMIIVQENEVTPAATNSMSFAKHMLATSALDGLILDMDFPNFDGPNILMKINSMEKQIPCLIFASSDYYPFNRTRLDLREVNQMFPFAHYWNRKQSHPDKYLKEFLAKLGTVSS